MLILTLRTDKPEAEIGLYDGTNQISYETWQAHRQLAETIHDKIRVTLAAANTTLGQLQGLVVYKGPGSFTGLRIGITVTNALADSLQLPIVGTETDSWLETGLARISAGQSDTIVMPEYGALPNITAPRK